MTALQCDLLVIGLGPAGGAAASLAARRGLSVVAVEKKKQVGVPVQCAEFIPLPMGKHAVENGVLVQRIEGMKSFLPGGAVTRSDFSGLMVDRAAFDQALARQAEQAGARILLGSRLEALDSKRFAARIAGAQASVEIHYRVLVAADGPHSFVAECLGLPRLATVNTRQYTVPLCCSYHDTDVWLSNAYPGGYAWLFPKGGLANLGLGADKHFARDLKAPLDSLHRRLIGSGLVGRDVVYRTGGAIPVGGLRKHLVVDDSIMLTGDAAGLTHPITGAGIAAAVVSGERAAEAAQRSVQLHDASALADFEDDIRDQFQGAIARAVERRRWLSCRWHTPDAMADSMHRKGWIAFPEYFA